MPNTMGDHFSPILILISPLSYLGGAWALLAFQILAILFGGVGIYYFVRERTGHRWLPIFAILHFFSIWGIYAALSFDYHNNVVGAMMLPWFLHFFLKKNWVKASIFFLLILCCKESMAVWLVFICVGAGLLQFRDPKMLKAGAIGALLAGIWFILCIKVIIPYAAGDAATEGYKHFKYSAFGGGFTEMIKNALLDPIRTIKLLFVSHKPENPAWNGVKMEFHYVVLLSGGIFLLYRPQFLIMAAPIFALKLFHDEVFKWGLIKHYCIEFVPLLSLAAFVSLMALNRAWLSHFLALLTVGVTMYGSFYFFNNRESMTFGNEFLHFYAPSHYRQAFDPKIAAEALKMIPEDAAVSAQNVLVPRLSSRKKIYLFPQVKDAEYVALVNFRKTWPLPKAEHTTALKCYWGSAKWENIYKKDKLYIFRKVGGGIDPCEHRNFKPKPQKKQK